MIIEIGMIVIQKAIVSGLAITVADVTRCVEARDEGSGGVRRRPRMKMMLLLRMIVGERLRG